MAEDQPDVSTLGGDGERRHVEGGDDWTAGTMGDGAGWMFLPSDKREAVGANDHF